MAMYRRVTYADRCQIHAFLQAQVSVQSISEGLGFHRSTVFREVARCRRKSEYQAQLAQRKAEKRRRFCRRGYLVTQENEGHVLFLLFSDLSPEQISKRLQTERVAKISHQTIYNYIRRHGRELIPFLRRYNRRGASRVRMTSHKREGKVSITLRPKESNQRSRIGDWERDCMYGANQERLLVCVDRKSRFTKITKVLGRTVREITKLTNSLLRGTKRKVHTITNDNGPEFRFPDGVLAPVFYCHPRRPQERGTVENTIGLIRQYIKRKTNLSFLNHNDLKLIEDGLNLRPRKCLDYKTPYEVFYGKSVALAL